MYDDFNGLVIEMLILADAIKSHYPTYVNLVTDEDHFKKHCYFRLILICMAVKKISQFPIYVNLVTNGITFYRELTPCSSECASSSGIKNVKFYTFLK